MVASENGGHTRPAAPLTVALVEVAEVHGKTHGDQFQRTDWLCGLSAGLRAGLSQSDWVKRLTAGLSAEVRAQMGEAFLAICDEEEQQILAALRHAAEQVWEQQP